MIGIILAVLIALFAALSIVSHTVYHRSNMATLAEFYLRWLNRDRDRILDEIDRTRERLHARLDQRPLRRGEGAILF